MTADAPAWVVERPVRGGWTALGYWPLTAAGCRAALRYAAACGALGRAVRMRVDEGSGA